MSIRIIVADDHVVVRKGIRFFLENEPDIELVGEASDGIEAVRMAHELKPDLVLMDLVMPGMDGIQATEQIRQELPETEVITLTSFLEDESIIKAIRAGAIGYILKNIDVEEMIRAIKAAAAGQVQLSPEAASLLMKEVRAPESPGELTEREKDVLRLIGEGLANKEIAQRLRISEGTVKSHVSNILAKLGVPSRTLAALYAARIGLVTTPRSR